MTSEVAEFTISRKNITQPIRILHKSMNLIDSKRNFGTCYKTSLTTGVCGGEVGGVKSDDFLMRRRPMGGERSTGEEDRSAGVLFSIISAILDVQRLLLLWVRKMRTTPFRGPLGEYSLRARTSTSVQGEEVEGGGGENQLDRQLIHHQQIYYTT